MDMNYELYMSMGMGMGMSMSMKHSLFRLKLRIIGILKDFGLLTYLLLSSVSP
jgi:hypothetical protein